jgi:hypothetical protein
MHGACRQYLPFTAASSQINASFEISQVLEHCKILDWALGLGAPEPRAEILLHVFVLSHDSHLISSSFPLFPFSPFFTSIETRRRRAEELHTFLDRVLKIAAQIYPAY